MMAFKIMLFFISDSLYCVEISLNNINQFFEKAFKIKMIFKNSNVIPFNAKKKQKR